MVAWRPCSLPDNYGKTASGYGKTVSGAVGAGLARCLDAAVVQPPPKVEASPALLPPLHSTQPKSVWPSENGESSKHRFN